MWIFFILGFFILGFHLFFSFSIYWQKRVPRVSSDMKQRKAENAHIGKAAAGCNNKSFCLKHKKQYQIYFSSID